MLNFVRYLHYCAKIETPLFPNIDDFCVSGFFDAGIQ